MSNEGHVEDTNLLVNLLPANYPDLYDRNATIPGIINKENDFTDTTGVAEANGGAIPSIRKSNKEKISKPTVCPKTHCPDPL